VDEFANTAALTVVAGPAEAPRRRSAEFVPEAGLRKTGESTLPWKERSALDLSSIVKRIRHRLSWLPGSRLVLVGSLVLFLVLVALLGCLFLGLPLHGAAPPAGALLPTVDSGSSAPEPRSGAGSPEAGEPREPKEMAGSGSLGSGEEQGDQSGFGQVRLRDAADAIAEGRLHQALSLYRQLAAREPQDPSYLLSVRILAQAMKGRDK
jgi:hypothetical protein